MLGVFLGVTTALIYPPCPILRFLFPHPNFFLIIHTDVCSHPTQCTTISLYLSIYLSIHSTLFIVQRVNSCTPRAHILPVHFGSWHLAHQRFCWPFRPPEISLSNMIPTLLTKPSGPGPPAIEGQARSLVRINLALMSPQHVAPIPFHRFKAPVSEEVAKGWVFLAKYFAIGK